MANRKVKGDITIGVKGKKKRPLKTQNLSAVIKDAIMADPKVVKKVNEKIKKGIKREIAKKEVYTESREIKKSVKSTITMTFQHNGKGNPKMEWENMDTSIKGKYGIVARLFYKIVCRTPVDEPYYYSMINYNEFGNPTGIRTRKHTIDENVTRDGWCISLNIKGNSGSKYMNVSDFSGCDWEDENGSGWKTVMNILLHTYQEQDFFTYHIWNNNEHVKVLEFGEYTTIDTPEEHTGLTIGRKHGVVGGYSIQAPRGMVRISKNEIENANIEAGAINETHPRAKKKTFGAKDIKNDVTFNVQLPVKQDDENAKVWWAVRDYIQKGGDILSVSEKDLAEALSKGLKKVPFTMAEKKAELDRILGKEKEQRRKRALEQEAQEELKKALEKTISKNMEMLLKRDEKKRAKEEKLASMSDDERKRYLTKKENKSKRNARYYESHKTRLQGEVKVGNTAIIVSKDITKQINKYIQRSEQEKDKDGYSPEFQGKLIVGTGKDELSWSVKILEGKIFVNADNAWGKKEWTEINDFADSYADDIVDMLIKSEKIDKNTEADYRETLPKSVLYNFIKNIKEY